MEHTRLMNENTQTESICIPLGVMNAAIAMQTLQNSIKTEMAKFKIYIVVKVNDLHPSTA